MKSFNALGSKQGNNLKHIGIYIYIPSPDFLISVVEEVVIAIVLFGSGVLKADKQGLIVNTYIVFLVII